MPFQTIHIKTNGQKLFMLAGAVLCFVLAFLFVKWSLGHTISIRAQQKEVADVSTGFAPDDPQTHFSSAVLHEKSFDPENFVKAVNEYQIAVALSPNDYLFWLALGKARERGGDAVGAEKALRRAVELAPNYVDTHWTLGNNLLRQGKTAEAFAEIRKSAAGSDKYVIPAIATSWQIFNGDLNQIKQSVGDSPKLNAFLAVFLLKQERLNEAFEIWDSLPDEMKSVTFRKQSEEIYRQMINAGKYRFAKIIKSSIEGSNTARIFGTFTDGGFEANVKKENTDPFDWQIGEGNQPLIGFDDKIKHGGDLSLVIIFNSPDGQDFRPVSQIIAVEAGKSYRFTGFYKTDLKASGTLRWEILNVADRVTVAATEELAANTDWKNIEADFTVPENAEAVIVNLVRVKCSSTICPIIGKVWFDDFELNKK